MCVVGEDGIDAGGLAKDWFGLVANHLLQKKYYLFDIFENEKGGGGEELIHISLQAKFVYNPVTYALLFKAIGLFLGKALQDGQTIGLKFNPLLLLYLAGQIPTLQQIAATDSQYYQSLLWVTENDVQGNCSIDTLYI